MAQEFTGVDLSEKTPLVKQEAAETRLSKYAKGAEYTACFLVALPTAFLSGLAALSDDPSSLDDLHSPHDLYQLMSHANGRIVYGIIAFSASEAVLFFLNKRYLLASTQASLDLIKRTVLTLRSSLCSDELRSEDRASLAENILFFSSLLTSLIFAEIGGKAFSFLGTAGEVTGFSLSLLVYFTTRYAGAKIFFRDLFDRNWRGKQKYLNRLSIIDEKTAFIEPQMVDEEGDYQTNLTSAMEAFLTNLDSTYDNLPKMRGKHICLDYAAPLLGLALVIITPLPILVSFIPQSVQGTEMITRTSIGADDHYQNASSLTLGTFITALTLFFYEVNIKDLPKHILATASDLYEKLKQGDIRAVVKPLALTLLAAGASYCSGIGFQLVARSALSNGYLTYLGSWLSGMIPDGLLVAVTSMLWSHLQELISRSTSSPKKLIGHVTSIDCSNVSRLLEDPQTSITGLLGRNRASFFQKQKRRDSLRQLPPSLGFNIQSASPV